MKKIILIVSIFLPSLLHCQVTSNTKWRDSIWNRITLISADSICRTGGFEHGNFNGWTHLGLCRYSAIFDAQFRNNSSSVGCDAPVTTGCWPVVSSTPLTPTLNGYKFDQKINTGGNISCLTNIIIPKVKNGNYAAQLGGESLNSVNGHVDGIVTKFVVNTSSQQVINFDLALRMADFSFHPDEGAAYFYAAIIDSLGNVINYKRIDGKNSASADPWVEFETDNNPGNPCFCDTARGKKIFYRNWKTESLTIPANNLGKKFALIFLSADCSHAGHSMAAYLDNICISNPQPQSSSVNVTDTCIANGNGKSIKLSYNIPTGFNLSDFRIGIVVYQNGTQLQYNGTSVPDFIIPTNSIGTHTFNINRTNYYNLDTTKCVDYYIVLNKKNAYGVFVTLQTIGNPNDGIRPGLNNDLCCTSRSLPCRANCNIFGSMLSTLGGTTTTFQNNGTYNVICNTQTEGDVRLICTNPNSTTILTPTCTNAMGQTVSPFWNGGVFNFPSNAGVYTATYYKLDVSGNKCDSFKVNFNVNCPPCPCPTVIQKNISLGGHCGIMDTIKNTCGKNIVSWTLKVNGQYYTNAGYPLTPQNIAANSTVTTGTIGLFNLLPINTLVYTFKYANGDSCTVTKTLNNCIPPPCPACTINVTANVLSGGSSVLLTGNNNISLKCSTNYILLPGISCTPSAPLAFDAAYAKVTDNYNVTWAINANAGGQFTLPGNMPANRNYVLNIRWRYIRSAGDTCYYPLAYPFKVECSPCGTICTPTVNVTGSNNYQTILNTNNNYSCQISCGANYLFTPSLNCAVSNGTIIKGIQTLSITNTPIPTPFWITYSSSNYILNVNPPANTTGVYQVRYYIGRQNLQLPCDSFTIKIDIQCKNITCGTWIYKGFFIEGEATPQGNFNIPCGTTKNAAQGKKISILGAQNCMPSGISTVKTIVTGPTGQIVSNETLGDYNAYDSLYATECGLYTIRLLSTCDKLPCDSCTYYVNVICPKDCCKGGYWEKFPTVAAESDDKILGTLNCKKTSKIIISDEVNAGYCNSMIRIDAGSYVCGDKSCASKVEFILSNSNGVVLSDVTNMDIPGTLPNGNYTLVMKVYCGSQLCDTCQFEFIKKCAGCNCKTAKCVLKYYYQNPMGGNVPVTCDAGVVTLECNKTYKFGANTNCQNICSATVNGTLFNNGVPVQTYTNISASNLAVVNFTTSGNYTFLYRYYVNGVECSKCDVRINVNCPPPVCTPCPVTVSTSTVSVTTVANEATSNAIQKFTFANLPANILTVKASVTDVKLWAVDENGKANEECLSCNNNPKNWASIFNGTGVSGATPKLSMNGGHVNAPVVLQPQQNTRSIIWHNGTSPLSISNDIQLYFKLPLSSTLSCCKRKATVCIKFVFRNDKCEDCLVNKCFDIEIK
ncbi:MAG: hypothetical protein JNM14_05840 [Ferruginibacter sp.]|nr:hypothetical protein [Ferruginibacter sp.]